jgi:hypothetical protein
LLGNDREISMCITTVTFPKHLLPIFMSWFCPAYKPQHVTI